MCLGAEIGMTLVGLYYLLTGKAKISKTHQLVGMPVRIMGFILLMTLPVALTIGYALGVLVAIGGLPQSLMQYTFVVDLFAIIVIFGISAGYYYSVKAQATEINPSS